MAAFCLSSSCCCVTAQARDILVGRDYNHEILRYDQQTGNFITHFAGDSTLLNPAFLLFGSDGNLYVTGQTSNNVVRFDGQTGAFIDEFVTLGDGGLLAPAFKHKADLFV